MKKIFLFLTIFLTILFFPILVNAEINPTGFNFCMGSVCASSTFDSRTNGIHQNHALRVTSSFQIPYEMGEWEAMTINAFYVVCSSTNELINDIKYADVEVTKLNYTCKFMDGGTGTPYLFHLSNVNHNIDNDYWTYQSGPIFNSLSYHAVWYVMNYYLSEENIDNNSLIAYMKTMEDGIVWNINSSMNQILDKLNNLNVSDGVIAGINNNTNQKFDELNNNMSAMGSSINSNIDSMKEKQDETNDLIGGESENTEDSKCGVICKLKGIFTGIIELPSKLVSLLIDALKNLFVPTDEQLYEIINDSKDLAENFGFVGESMNFFITIFTSLLGMVNANGCIELPEFTIGSTSLTPSITFWHAQNVCLNDNLILSSNITTIRTITSIALVALFVNFATRKFFSILNKNENDNNSISYDPRTGEVRE